jgi:hypothetical protein
MEFGSTWRVTAAVKFPVAVMPGTPLEQGSILPQSLKFVSRIPAQMTQELSGILITLGPWRGPTLPVDTFGTPSELARLSFLTTADSGESALSQMYDLIELVLDALSFQLQEAIDILQMEVLDVTPPLAVGMTRNVLFYPFPIGFHSPKFSQSIILGNIQAVFTPSLPMHNSIDNEKTRAALRWYVKGLAAPFDVERFISYWITLEILCSDNDIIVEKPYIARCGHEIRHCPICSAPTSRIINGPTIKKFLTEQLGIESADAKKLWGIRQMFHGANHLTQQATKELPRLVIVAQNAALMGLKRSLGIGEEMLPLSSPEAVSVQGPAFGGTREIQDYDLDP